jgi:hypothetical protein
MEQTAKEYLKASGQEYEFTESERGLVIDLLEGYKEQLTTHSVDKWEQLKDCGLDNKHPMTLKHSVNIKTKTK